MTTGYMPLIQMTGLSGAGKTTIAQGAYKILTGSEIKCYIIDGDTFRDTLCSDLGFSKNDRIENIRRLSIVAATLARNGIVPIIAAINPYHETRAWAYKYYDNVYTIYIECPINILRKRDTKGLYRRAELPKDDPKYIPGLTGVSDPFEIPLHPDLIIDTNTMSVFESTNTLTNFILEECV